MKFTLHEDYYHSLPPANAYWGHTHSFFVTSKEERRELHQIYRDELHHRARLREILKELKSQPRLLREIGMYMVGFTIGFLCLFGGWFIPMYGAGKLESTNVAEYEVAARLAYRAGLTHMVEELLFFAEIEWDHEDYFFKKTTSKPWHRYTPLWQRPAPRANIQHSFARCFHLAPHVKK